MYACRYVRMFYTTQQFVMWYSGGVNKADKSFSEDEFSLKAKSGIASRRCHIYSQSHSFGLNR